MLVCQLKCSGVLFCDVRERAAAQDVPPPLFLFLPPLLTFPVSMKYFAGTISASLSRKRLQLLTVSVAMVSAAALSLSLSLSLSLQLQTFSLKFPKRKIEVLKKKKKKLKNRIRKRERERERERRARERESMKTTSELETEALRSKVKDLRKACPSPPDANTFRDSFRSTDEVESHVRFLVSGLRQLNSGFVTLDASRAWLLYWILHGLSLLGVEYDGKSGHLTAKAFVASEGLASLLKRAPRKQACLDFIESCQNPSGGFGGGPQQLSHIATTYASVAALFIVGGKDALREVADREKTKVFLQRLQVQQSEYGGSEYGGSFRVHIGGEVDMRACYLAMAVCRFLELNPAEFLDLSGMVEYIKRCQTYEGGFGGEPGNEAHGGYSYCGFAALALVGMEDQVDLFQLLDWASSRQQTYEGGFNGRTNKLTDSCYSFWQGALLCLLERSLSKGKEERKEENSSDEKCGNPFKKDALRNWILVCCQLVEGGFRDKPGVRPDYYHTCYALSGLYLTHNANVNVLLCNVRNL